MNFRRGFFRIWLILSAIYTLLICIIFFDDVRQEFKKQALLSKWNEISVLLLPVLCDEARGEAKRDYNPPEGNYFNRFDAGALCWYEEPKFRQFYPEYRDLTTEMLSGRLYSKAGIATNRARPWTTLFVAVVTAIGVPLLVLILGAGLGWALAGFLSPSKRDSS